MRSELLGLWSKPQLHLSPSLPSGFPLLVFLPLKMEAMSSSLLDFSEETSEPCVQITSQERFVQNIVKNPASNRTRSGFTVSISSSSPWPKYLTQTLLGEITYFGSQFHSIQLVVEQMGWQPVIGRKQCRGHTGTPTPCRPQSHNCCLPSVSQGPPPSDAVTL